MSSQKEINKKDNCRNCATCKSCKPIEKVKLIDAKEEWASDKESNQ